MRELKIEELQQVGGGALTQAEKLGVGLGMWGLGAAIVATGPLGWIGVLAVVSLGYWGGTVFGTGLSSGG